MLKKNITGAKYYSSELHQMTNLNIATPIDKNDVNFGQSDILLAQDVIKLINDADSEVISEIKTLINTLNKKVEQNSGNISTLDQKFTGLFEVVNTLPNINDAQLGKIYCVKDTSSTETENKYIEWVKLKNTDDTYKFEKVGEFNATPDLSGYAKLSGAKFTGNVIGNSASFTDLFNTTTGTLYIGTNSVGTGRLIDKDPSERSNTRTYNTKGGFAELGTTENFVFTLEDGYKVTKSIRVVSTTNS